MILPGWVSVRAHASRRSRTVAGVAARVDEAQEEAVSLRVIGGLLKDERQRHVSGTGKGVELGMTLAELEIEPPGARKGRKAAVTDGRGAVALATAVVEGFRKALGGSARVDASSEKRRA